MTAKVQSFEAKITGVETAMGYGPSQQQLDSNHNVNMQGP